jgi:hypothetical protein
MDTLLGGERGRPAKLPGLFRRDVHPAVLEELAVVAEAAQIPRFGQDDRRQDLKAKGRRPQEQACATLLGIGVECIS